MLISLTSSLLIDSRRWCICVNVLFSVLHWIFRGCSSGLTRNEKRIQLSFMLMTLQNKPVASRLPEKAFPEGFYSERYILEDSQLAFSLMSSSSQLCICSVSLRLLQSWQLHSSASSSRTAWRLRSYGLRVVVLCISASRPCLEFLPHAFSLLCYPESNLPCSSGWTDHQPPGQSDQYLTQKDTLLIDFSNVKPCFNWINFITGVIYLEAAAIVNVFGIPPPAALHTQIKLQWKLHLFPPLFTRQIHSLMKPGKIKCCVNPAFQVYLFVCL